jgi:phosphoribosylanthranilate isomerase
VSPWVKICANTSLGDVSLAAEAGADAVGFVFAPSPRRVTPSEVAGMVAKIPTGIERIGVFVDASLEEIVATVEDCKLTGVQLHSEIGRDIAALLRRRFRPLRILRVVHFGADAARRVDEMARDPNVDAILVDSRIQTAVGGTGVTYDWREARATLFGNGQTDRPRMVAAGGLNPDNVAEAIATLHPWGVDVVSGVEAAPGRKDPAKVREFVANARRAMRAEQRT